MVGVSISVCDEQLIIVPGRTGRTARPALGCAPHNARPMAMTTRPLVEARAGGACEYCRLLQAAAGVLFHVEHVIPRSRGGDTVMSNLATDHAHCGAERCRNRCRPPRIRGVPTHAGLHRKRADGRGDQEARTRKKPRQKRGFSHQVASTCIGLQSGEGGIRTLGTLACTPVFETGPIGHSGTSPNSLKT